MPLTRKEYCLLELFLRNSRRIFSPSVIANLLWSFEEPPDENTIRSHITSLRQKLKKVGAPADLIETVYGTGYRLRTFSENEKPMVFKRLPPPQLGQRKSSAQQRIKPELAEVWQHSKDQLSDRIANWNKPSLLGRLMLSLANCGSRQSRKPAPW